MCNYLCFYKSKFLLPFFFPVHRRPLSPPPPLLPPPPSPPPPPPLPLSPLSTSAALAASLSTACATASRPTTSILAIATGSRSSLEASNSCRAERRSASRHGSPVVGDRGEAFGSAVVLQVKSAVALQMER